MGRFTCSLSALTLSACGALTLSRLLSYVVETNLSNPGVPLLAATLTSGGLFSAWWRVGRQLDPPLQRPTPNMRALISTGLGCVLYLWTLANAWARYPLRALNQHHEQVIEGALSGVTLECVGLWLLWWGWRAQRPERWREALTFPLIMGLFIAPWEPWLRRWDEPLQRLGAELGAALVTWVSALCELWGSPPITLTFWNPYTFRSSAFYLIINETCSGVNLLLSSALYAVGFTWLTHGSPRGALWLTLCSIPISLALNGARIAMIFLLGHHGGVELAMGPWHEGSAYLMQLPLVISLAYLSPKSQGNSGAQRS